MTDDEFLGSFMNCTLPAHAFRHRDHLRLAWILVRRAAGFDHRHDAFAERAEFRRRGGRIAVERVKIIEIEL